MSDTTETTSGKDLRAQLEAALEDIRAERAKREAAEAKLQARTLEDFVKAKGLSPKVAQLAAAHVQEPTPEKLDAWLTDYADVFGIQPQTNTPPAETPSDESRAPQGAPALDEATQRALAFLATQGQGAGVAADPALLTSQTQAVNGLDVSQYSSEAELMAALQGSLGPQ